MRRTLNRSSCTKANHVEVWLICDLTYVWANNKDGHLRRHRARYGITVMGTADDKTSGRGQRQKITPVTCTVRKCTVYPKKYAHGFVVLCFAVVMQSFIMNSHEVFIHIHQGCFAGTGAIVRLPQCQWSKPNGYGKISQCITTTKHSKAKTVCIFLGIYCKAGGTGNNNCRMDNENLWERKFHG